MLGLLLLQVLASCLWLGHSEVVTSFASCPQFFYAGSTPNDALNPQNPAWICQRYNNSHHFATLYDRDRRIPVYSAYIYINQLLTAKRDDNKQFNKELFVEPQLINSTYHRKDMDTEKSIGTEYNITPQQIGQSQAITQDYNSLQDLEPSHLCPTSHQSDCNSRSATYSLTNTVPLESTLKNGAWREYELITMQNKIGDCTTTYIITGVVPGNAYVSGGRVNRPSYIWSAACCLVGTNHSMKAWGAIADNGLNDNNEVLVVTLWELEEMLTQLYRGKRVTLFSDACPRQ